MHREGKGPEWEVLNTNGLGVRDCIHLRDLRNRDTYQFIEVCEQLAWTNEGKEPQDKHVRCSICNKLLISYLQRSSGRYMLLTYCTSLSLVAFLSVASSSVVVFASPIPSKSCGDRYARMIGRRARVRSLSWHIVPAWGPSLVSGSRPRGSERLESVRPNSRSESQ